MEKNQSQNICEESEYKKVFVQYAQLIRNFFYYKFGDLEEAEDAMQDTFLKLWQNCSKVSREKAKAYAFQIAKNMFLNTKKHDKVIFKFHQTIQPEELSTSYSAQELLEEKEFGETLERALAELSPSAREVFLLNRVEQLKYKEIAEILNISVKAVEKRMHKALVELRKVHKSI